MTSSKKDVIRMPNEQQSLLLQPDSDSQNQQPELFNSKQIKAMQRDHDDDLRKQTQKANPQKYILLGLITIILYLMLSQSSEKGNTPVLQEDFLHIKSNKGKLIKLPYLNSKLIKPAKIPQPSPGIVHIPSSSQFTTYAQSFQSQIKFSSELFLNWGENNQTMFQAQFYRYHKKYNLQNKIPERAMCIMAPFHNLLKYGQGGSFNAFLNSVNSQNYSNYRVYMVDDFSDDNSVEAILRELPKYPRLSNRIWIFKNKQAIGALGNRDSTTRNYCESGDIVMDIDGDDALIGKQVFNIYNRIYHNNPKTWFMYTNFLAVKGSSEGDGRKIQIDMSKARTGKCATIKPQIHKSNTYRTDLNLWVTSQLRTYLRDLYIKIPLDYVLERGTAKYYWEASDRFVMYALAELAGPDHTFYYQQYVYFYYEPNFQALATNQCILPVLFFCQVQARILTPLSPLQTLHQQKAQIDPFYIIPKHILDAYIKRQLKLFQCLQKQDRMLSQIFINNQTVPALKAK